MHRSDNETDGKLIDCVNGASFLDRADASRGGLILWVNSETRSRPPRGQWRKKTTMRTVGIFIYI